LDVFRGDSLNHAQPNPDFNKIRKNNFPPEKQFPLTRRGDVALSAP